MGELSVEERDLLERAWNKPELRPLLFRKLKGLKWFDDLHNYGYFSAQNMPPPVPAKEEGYINIPGWAVLDYLVKTVPELTNEAAKDYAPRFLEIITSATAYAKEQEFGNHHVWGQFSEVLSQIPSEYLSPDNLDVISYWLEDRYERGHVAEVIGEKWLTKLLEEDNVNSLAIASKLLGILYNVDFIDREIAEKSRREAQLKFDYYYADKITKKIAALTGYRLGRQAVSVFYSKR